MENPAGRQCVRCGAEVELRDGVCFDCATAGEIRLARRSVAEHVMWALEHTAKGQWYLARMDARCAWERLTRSGAYARGGYFERRGIDVDGH